MRDRPKVGEILIQAGIIDELQLASALGEQSRWGRRLGMTLIKLGMVQEGQLVRALARQFDLPVASLAGKKIAPEVIGLIPAKVAHEHSVIPLFVKKEGRKAQLFLGMEEPSDLGILDDLAFRTGMSIRPVMVGPTEIGEAIDRYYTSRPNDNPAAAKSNAPAAVVPSAASMLAESLGDTLSETNLRRIQEEASPAPMASRSTAPTPAPAAAAATAPVIPAAVPVSAPVITAPAPAPEPVPAPIITAPLPASTAPVPAPTASAPVAVATASAVPAPSTPLSARVFEAVEEITSPVVTPVVSPAPVLPVAPVAPRVLAPPAESRTVAPLAEERVAIDALTVDVARAIEETERTRLVAKAIAHLLIEKGILTLDELQARIEKVKGPRSGS